MVLLVDGIDEVDDMLAANTPSIFVASARAERLSNLHMPERSRVHVEMRDWVEAGSAHSGIVQTASVETHAQWQAALDILLH